MASMARKMHVLSGHVDAAEEREDAKMPPVNHRPAHTARRRAIPRGSPDPDQEVVEEVHRRVAKRMRQLPALPGDEDSCIHTS